MFTCPRCHEEVPDNLVFAHCKAHIIQEQFEEVRDSHPEIRDDIQLELGNEEGG